MIIRNAEYKDIPILKNIWKMRFGDEDSFIDWFFNERFYPDHTTVIEEDDIIVSCLYSMPVTVNVRGSIENGILISGVSTLPEYEGKGLMRKSLTHHLRKMKSLGFNISLLKAVRPEIYYSLEHRLINEVLFVKSLSKSSAAFCTKRIDISSNYNALYDCYNEFAHKYSGMVLRSFGDYKIKCREYEQTQAECLAFYKNNEIDAYCFYFNESGELTIDQFVAVSKEGYKELLSYIKNELSYNTLEIKLSCDAPFELLNDYCKVHGNSAYLMDVQEILRKTGLSGFSLEVTDSVIEENNGVFSLSGERINKSPELRISNGALAQWIFGYKSIEQLVSEGLAICFDRCVIEYMDSLKTNPCYCLDEY